MTHPRITLGGVPIVLHAGAPAESIEPIGGSTVLRMSDGAAIKQQHWGRLAGTISAEGWMPPGLSGLDYSGPLELRSTQVLNVVGAGLTFDLPGTPRPDVAPWGHALVGDQWVRTACAYANGEATLASVLGATLYQLCWMPVLSVFANRPAQSQGAAAHGWSISWEEV